MKNYDSISPEVTPAASLIVGFLRWLFAMLRESTGW